MTDGVYIRGQRGDIYLMVGDFDVLELTDEDEARSLLESLGENVADLLEPRSLSSFDLDDAGDPTVAREELIRTLAAEISSGRLVPVRVDPPFRGLDPVRSVPLSDLVEPRSDPPPDPLRPGGKTSPVEKTLSYELRLVDELGVPIEDASLSLSVSGASRRLVTDADGRTRVDDATTGFAIAQVVELGALRDALRPRWEVIREGEWLAEREDHTYIDCAEPLPALKVRSERLHTIVLQPRVICARILELLFETNKAFPLPSALAHIRAVCELYEERPRAKVLIVGHTDTTGEPDVNKPLSLTRAQSIKAYLCDDVGAWLDYYGAHMHPNARWGSHEDQLMLGAVLAKSGEQLTDIPLRHFQATRGLKVDNDLGPNTRRALIAEYMSADNASLPAGIEAIAHGCGEAFPLEKTASESKTAHAIDRRVELFFFDGDLGILPPPQGEISGPEHREYPEWRRRSVETHSFRAIIEPPVRQPTRSFPGAMFGFDSAFPTSAITHLVKFAQELTDKHKEARIGLFGHADQRGDEVYNKNLADRRAEIAFALLTEDFPRFREVAHEEDWGADCYQAMLRTLGCNPGAIDGNPGELTASAVEAFRGEYNDDAFHPGDRRARAFGELPPGGALDTATKDAILDAYHADLCGAIEPARFLGPQFSGCGEFNPCSDDDTENRRVTLAIWGQDAPSANAFPCRKGDAGACDLVAAADDRRRCRFYREHVDEDPPRDDIEPFWDFAWLETPTKKAHLSALTTLPDCEDLTFTVQLSHTRPAELGSAGFGQDVAEHGPVMGRMSGLVRKGVAYALWTPEDYDPFEATSWFRHALLEPAPREVLPAYQPPVFTILGHGTWGVAGPPGSDLSRLELVEQREGPLVALRHDGKFILVRDGHKLGALRGEHRIIAVSQAERRFIGPEDEEDQ
jgi:outer membrane protein OmpA-like peptidoglycan-associated protein